MSASLSFSFRSSLSFGFRIAGFKYTSSLLHVISIVEERDKRMGFVIGATVIVLVGGRKACFVPRFDDVRVRSSNLQLHHIY